MKLQKITPFLWFDDNAEDAAKLYVSLFPKSKILATSRYGEGGPGKPGSVMTVRFRVAGQEIIAINGGPYYKLSPAFSLSVDCKTQKEIDTLWTKLLKGGGEPNMCGWLTDRFGLSWQLVPTVLVEHLSSKDRAKANRVMSEMMTMQKLDIARLEAAAKGPKAAAKPAKSTKSAKPGKAKPRRAAKKK